VHPPLCSPWDFRKSHAVEIVVGNSALTFSAPVLYLVMLRKLITPVEVASMQVEHRSEPTDQNKDECPYIKEFCMSNEQWWGKESDSHY
jgi:hypothetical protein